MPRLLTHQDHTGRNMTVTLSPDAYKIQVDKEGDHFLRSPRNVTISGGATLVIDTGLTITVPEGTVLVLTPVSDDDTRLHLWPQAYGNGELRITTKFTNLSEGPVLVRRGDKIAQLTTTSEVANWWPHYIRLGPGLEAGQRRDREEPITRSYPYPPYDDSETEEEEGIAQPPTETPKKTDLETSEDVDREIWELSYHLNGMVGETPLKGVSQVEAILQVAADLMFAHNRFDIRRTEDIHRRIWAKAR